MPKPFTNHPDNEAVRVVEYPELKVVAEKYGVDPSELNFQANCYMYNLNILNVSIANRRKRLELIRNYIYQGKLKQARDAYDASDMMPDAFDLSEDYILERVQAELDILPDARKGQNKTHRHTFVLSLAKMFPDKVSLSRSNNAPSSPFFNFCRDVFTAIGDKSTDEAIAKSIRIIK